jgi:hypothetical protein
MRRLVLVLGVVALAACEPLKDAFSARVDVAARAAGETLTVERLSQLAGLSKQVPLQPDALRRLATVWVDYTLLAVAVSEGRSLDDSATVLAAMWPAVAQLRWERFHDTVLTQRLAVSDAQVDSAYAAGELRLFQHILLRTAPSAAPPEVAARERQAGELVRQVRRDGSRFAQLAALHSEDPGSKERGGLLAVRPRGEYVQAFEDAAWQLPPGGVTDVVRTSFGLHVIRRPPLTEVRDVFQEGLEERRSFVLDSMLVDSIGKARRLRTESNAPALTRQLVQNFESSRGSGARLASYAGGRFRVRDLARWLMAMDPNVAQGISSASDSQVTQFVRVVAERQMLVQAAEESGTKLTAEDWAYLRATHDSALRTLYTVVGLDPQALGDSAATPDAMRRLAMARVNDYLDRVLAGRTQFFPVPPFFGEALRQNAKWSVSAAGLRRALERAKTLRAGQDSAGAPRVTPAPGPAPIPGADSGTEGGR